MTNLNVQLSHTPIAIIGMGAIMPQARNLREFWSNIVGKVDCITDVPESHWKIEDYYDPDPTAPDKTYCKRGGFLPEVDFDPMEFGLPPNILEVTDVSQMLSLIVARDALTDAGYINASVEIRDRTGIVLGVGGGQKQIVPLSSRLQYPVWEAALKSSGLSDEETQKIIEKIKLAYIRWEENSFPGMLGNVIAGRIANRFDLGGINCVTDAACASSLSALRLAVSELTERRADMMITGGVDTDNSIVMYMNFSKTPAFTKGTHPRPFDVESDGMMVGEGIGMIVMKRLEDAVRDGDRIYAVIKGIGASSDGRFKSIYAPRGEGQEKALKRAYEDAGFSPSTVTLFEAHGTGTVAGDTTEVTTAVRYFNQNDPKKQHIALGSVKSQIGHAKAAAGAAGLIKTALALYHKVLPPTLNVNQPNPKFDLETSAFYVNTETRPWLRPDENTPRRAGVSSFGFGGTNFHIVMEEYNPDHQSEYRLHNIAQELIFHAPNPADLQNKLREVLTNLQSDDSQRHFLNYAKETRTLNIVGTDARVGFVALDAKEAAGLVQVALDSLISKAQVEEWQHPKGVYYRRNGMNLNGRVVALFAGQGSQYLDMGRELAVNFPEIRESFRQLDILLHNDGKTGLSDVVYPRPTFSAEERQGQEEQIQNTNYAQPAIGALSAGMYRLLQKAGFRADFTAGHSFGELSALWAAGVLTDADYYKLVKARGAAMARPDDPNFDAGTMLAVTGDVDAIEREVGALSGVQVANRNSRTQVVLAGSKNAIKNAEESLKAKGYRVVQLSVSAAFHSPLVGHAREPFARAINAATFHKPHIPVYSNATGMAYPADPAQIKQKLTDHILQAVLFRDEIENLYAAGGYAFVEFGPRNVLTNLVKDILGDKPHVAIALNGSRQKNSDRQLREAAVQLRVLGLGMTSVDNYIVDIDTTPKKKGMSVKLSGAAYVSQKTRDTYQDALQNGFKIARSEVTPPPQPQPIPVPQPEPLPTPQPEPLPEPTPAPPPAPQPLPPVQPPQPATPDVPTQSVNVLASLEGTLAQFRDHQRETQRAQEQYLQNQAEYFRIFFELTQQQQGLIAQGANPQVIEAVTQSMMRFHDYQSETVHLHEKFMQEQSSASQTLLNLIRQQYATLASQPAAAFTAAPVSAPVARPQVQVPAPVVPQAQAQPAPVQSIPVAQPQTVVAPVQPVPAASGVDVTALSNAMLRIVSDKTGYPMDMLELSMDMEADLGIDSIKRVEILGAMRDEFPNLPQFKPEELAELRTLEQIVDYMRASVNGAAPVQAVSNVVAAPAPVQTSPVVQVQPVAAPVQAPTSGGSVSVESLSNAMLRIVSDKTGYPMDMLELDMDMEADLGIDSIKRVEILGAMRDEFPNLPQFKPEELAELRTLRQIVDYMRDALGGSQPTPPTAPTTTPTRTEPAPAPAVTAAPVQAQAVSAPATTSGGVDVSQLSAAMLRIVADKTGYPADMLELGMDMEADLGIDSIKRVEILGAMRDEFPALPQFKPEELAELRTLGEIVDYMRAASGGAVSPAATTPGAPVPVSQPAPVVQQMTVPVTPVMQSAPAPAGGGISVEALSGAMLRIVSDKTGYPADMLELSMDMEADLGIDSIKRVEILGAMRDEFPALPQFKPEELAELRTLGEIVDYMRASLNGAAAPAVQPAAAPVVQSAPAIVSEVAMPVTASTAPKPDASGVSVEALSGAMLRIVSDKTGYPADMLELTMDMEADLGIDSIKRVEILGAMRDEFPVLPQFKPEELAELRTLGQIVDYMRDASNGANAGDVAAEVSMMEMTHNQVNDVVPTNPMPVIDYQGIQRSVVEVRQLPVPDFMAFNPAGATCVITDDGTNTPSILAQKLNAEGWRTVILSFPQNILATQSNGSTPRVMLPDMSEAALKEALNNITGQYGAIGAFIHLNPSANVHNGSLFIENEKAIVKHIFLIAKYLKASLTNTGGAARKSFVAVTRLDGALGTGNQNGFGTIAGGLFGLVKTLNLEWNTVFCRAIDITPSTSNDQAASLIFAELHDPNRLLTEVAYGTQGRVTLAARQTTINGAN